MGALSAPLFFVYSDIAQKKEKYMQDELQKTLLIALAYSVMLSDIKEGKNLNQRLEETESLIIDLDKEISEAQDKPKLLKALEDIKNSLFYLKYEILERL